jgi:hypothetical protein
MPWTGTLDLNGYGKIIVNHKQIYTHRAAWELFNERPLPSGAVIGHYCHSTSCSNPQHIHVGTQKDNLDDSIRDMRHSFGERNGRSKLTEETAMQALHLRADGWPFRKIALHLSVTHAAIQALCYGQTWKHLPRP